MFVKCFKLFIVRFLKEECQSYNIIYSCVSFSIDPFSEKYRITSMSVVQVGTHKHNQEMAISHFENNLL